MDGGEKHRQGRVAEVGGAFLKLGLTAFGGPIAHLGYFRDELVIRRRWLSEQDYADLVALCQFLPGPTSSQVGFALGLMRAGWGGALVAFLAFTLPSFAILFLLASGVSLPDGPVGAGLLHGLKLVAVAVVAQAVLGMARTLCPDRARAGIAVLAVAVLAFWPGIWAMASAITLGAALGLGLKVEPAAQAAQGLRHRITPRAGLAALVLCLVLLVLLPILAASHPGLALADIFYHAGAMVFGGGHVVLPLLEPGMVQSGRVAPDDFLAGYALTQAMPGPLFTFAGWLGAVQSPVPHGLLGALLATGAIFLPGFLLLIAALPFWARLSDLRTARAMMQGANAAVVGILGAALYQPVFTGAVNGLPDLALALVLFVGLTRWSVPPWIIVLVGACGGVGLACL
ncbi:chromate efflux transporter [Gemmobacter serpentinus]|uniref:chromate efflux transporter n=1 Tax=Gemmobacter serpentinus TaxID=2652247 RepID=UPI00124E5F27|nr:chromate efflux transporter [Gemmobacter serpentinus]